MFHLIIIALQRQKASFLLFDPFQAAMTSFSLQCTKARKNSIKLFFAGAFDVSSSNFDDIFSGWNWEPCQLHHLKSEKKKS